MEEYKCSMIDTHKGWLTDLRLTVFGNGSKDNSLVTRVGELERHYHSITKQLIVITIFTSILLIAQVPELLRLFGVML